MMLFLFFTDFIISFFTSDVNVKKYAVDALRIISAGYIFYGIGMVMANAFNGAGDTRTPTFINLAGFWFFQVPLAWMLAIVLQMGPRGVFAAIPIAETAIAIAAYMLFRKGKWKSKVI